MISEKKVWWYDGLWLAGICPVRAAHLNTTITSIFILEQAVLARITDEWRHYSVWCCNQGPPFLTPVLHLTTSPRQPPQGLWVWTCLFLELEISWFLINFQGSVFVLLEHKRAAVFGNNVVYSLEFPINCLLRTSYTTLRGETVMSTHHARPRCACWYRP